MRQESAKCWKLPHVLPEHTGNRPAQRCKIQFCWKLSRIFYEQLRSRTVLLGFGMQFVYVVGHGKEQYLRGDLLVSAQKKLPEAVILLDCAKGAL